MSTVCILGRQPALGLAELESKYGPLAVMPIGNTAALVDQSPDTVPLKQLGGTVKVCKLLTDLPYIDWPQLVSYITDALPLHLPYIPEGKIRFGLSLYGFNVSINDINRAGLSMKKVIRDLGRSVRVVPNNQAALSTAQTIHNQLTGHTGMELVLIRSGNKTILAQVVNVQDIEAYAARDQARPKRDAKVGMLPPKLAQIIINLATGHMEDGRWKMVDGKKDSGKPTTNYQLPTTLLDPFCGTGVLLQEALLMGYDVCGTDIEPRMVDYAKENLAWLRTRYPEISGLASFMTGDATIFEWPSNIGTIAAETYLGRPFSTEPKSETLREVMQDVDTIHRKFLKNVAKQTKTGFRMCIAVPAWKKYSSGSSRTIRASAGQGAIEQRTEPYMKYGEGVAQDATQPSAANKSRASGSARGNAFVTDSFWHLPVLDSLEELGYNRVSFVHAGDKELIYHREGQIVGRELVTLIRK
jgi:tRNA G10  N-methylase Trm11